MREPKPLLEGEATEFERLLLESVLGERPSARSTFQMQQKLGLSGPGVWLAGGKAVLSTTGVKSALLVLGIASLWGGVHFASGPSADEGRMESAKSRAEPVPAPLPTPAIRVTPLIQSKSAAETNDLREEIDLLDRARAAMAGGERAKAKQLLESYAKRFADGTLAKDAALLLERVRTAP